MRASEPSSRAATLSPKGARRGTHPASLRYAVQGSDLSKSGHKQAVTESAWPPLQSIKESRPSQSRPHRPKCCCCIEITTSLPCGEVFSPPIRFMRRARPRQSSTEPRAGRMWRFDARTGSYRQVRMGLLANCVCCSSVGNQEFAG